MKLIVWLGNPWEHYENTRHNAGFLAIDAFAQSQWHERSMSTDRNAEWYKGGSHWVSYILAKPQTFMNKSWISVRKIAHFFKIDVQDIIVLHDEIDLPDGKIEYKIGGWHAGHNGLRNIIEQLWHKDFARVRIGVGRPATKEEVVEYVLSNFSKQEFITLENNYPIIEEKIIWFLEEK